MVNKPPRLVKSSTQPWGGDRLAKMTHWCLIAELRIHKKNTFNTTSAAPAWGWLLKHAARVIVHCAKPSLSKFHTSVTASTNRISSGCRHIFLESRLNTAKPSWTVNPFFHQQFWAEHTSHGKHKSLTSEFLRCIFGQSFFSAISYGGHGCFQGVDRS